MTNATSSSAHPPQDEIKCGYGCWSPTEAALSGAYLAVPRPHRNDGMGAGAAGFPVQRVPTIG